VPPAATGNDNRVAAVLCEHFQHFHRFHHYAVPSLKPSLEMVMSTGDEYW
jgi:hypothetical protein